MPRRPENNMQQELDPAQAEFICPYTTSIRDRMAAFDQLPLRLRMLLNYGPPLDPDPTFTLKAVQLMGEEWTVADVKAKLVESWARIDTPVRGPVRP